MRYLNKYAKTRIVLGIVFFVFSILGIIAINTISKNIAYGDEITQSIRVAENSTLTYYLKVKYDGVDKSGVESTDSVMADMRSGQINVSDIIPEGLAFEGFEMTEDGTFNAVSRADNTIICPGHVVDDTREVNLTSGTWDGDDYFYHGLHYSSSTRKVEFKVENLRAGCELVVGVITRTPTIEEGERRDFYDNAFVLDRNVANISNTVHAWMGKENAVIHNVNYEYVGDVPAGAPQSPVTTSYIEGARVGVMVEPELDGYVFSGWSTSDVQITNGSFTMPNNDVTLRGSWVENVQEEFEVSYSINGDAPSDYVAPKTRSYPENKYVKLDSTESGEIIDGYEFKGWDSDDVAIDDGGFEMPNRDVEIVGEFERVSYEVKYEFQGDLLPPNANSLLPATQSYYPGDTVTTAPDPTYDGYRFTGWFKNSSFIMPEEDVVIYGEWSYFNGLFAPNISVAIIDQKDEYSKGTKFNSLLLSRILTVLK